MELCLSGSFFFYLPFLSLYLVSSPSFFLPLCCQNHYVLVREMAQWPKVLVAMPEDLSLFPGSHTMEAEQ